MSKRLRRPTCARCPARSRSAQCDGPCRIKTKSGSTHVGVGGLGRDPHRVRPGEGRPRRRRGDGPRRQRFRDVGSGRRGTDRGRDDVRIDHRRAAGRLQARRARQEPLEPAEDRVRARSRLQGRGADAVRWNHGPMPMTSSETVLDADMLTGAVAFTDICGFTEFTAVRGDRDALLLLGTQDRLVRSCLPGRRTRREGARRRAAALVSRCRRRR